MTVFILYLINILKTVLTTHYCPLPIVCIIKCDLYNLDMKFYPIQLNCRSRGIKLCPLHPSMIDQFFKFGQSCGHKSIHDCVCVCVTPLVSLPHPAMKHFCPAVKFWPSGGKHTGWMDSVTDNGRFFQKFNWENLI